MTTPASSQLQQHTTSDDPSSDNRRPAYQQWLRPQLLFFLNLLFEARVNGALDSSCNANLTQSLERTIFSDDPPAGRQITEVDDNEGQFESLVTARIEEEGEEEPGPVAVSDIDEEEGEEESPPTNEVIIYDTQVSSTPARGLESPVRSRKKRKLPAIAANTSIEDTRKKTRSIKANTDLAISRLADTLAAHFAEAQRYPGSTDLERAVRDVLAYTKGRILDKYIHLTSELYYYTEQKPARAYGVKPDPRQRYHREAYPVEFARQAVRN
ncbi:unnamed protein product [Clonostachys chloroleuca]|uniref:Uncharacterized protein n=1 Tax=Clonostachys chloroleuca TaxID=1926264 RepID=A0AA35Q8C5_9HYPO|nr:unnamed protein product [Clonostachys chloroleuca]